MTSVPYWGDDPAAWQRFVLGPHVLPGYVVVRIKEVARQLDRKKPRGKSGGALEDNGCKAIQVEVEVHLLKKHHHESWDVLFPQINPRREGATKDPFECRYPALDELDPGPFVVQSIVPGVPSAKNGRVMTIRLEEWFADAKPVKKGTGAIKRATTAERVAAVQIPLTLDDSEVSDAQIRAIENIRAYNDMSKDTSPPDPTGGDALSAMIGDLTGTSRE